MLNFVKKVLTKFNIIHDKFCQKYQKYFNYSARLRRQSRNASRSFCWRVAASSSSFFHTGRRGIRKQISLNFVCVSLMSLAWAVLNKPAFTLGVAKFRFNFSIKQKKYS